jgi:uncharacterized protein (DUF1778 family)
VGSRKTERLKKKKGRPFDDPDNPKGPILNFRTSAADRERIDEAASAVGESPGAFAREATLERAKRVLKKSRTAE